jgi:cystathionine gamma-lyase
VLLEGNSAVGVGVNAGQQAAHDFCKYTKVFTLAESLGGVESLCEVPSSMIIKDSGGLALFLGDTSMGHAGGHLAQTLNTSQTLGDSVDLHADVMQALSLAAVGKKA